MIVELIDLRSFSNLWYWIALAVLWSSISHWVLGVPYDMVTRARKVGGQAQADLEGMVRINVNRFLYITRVSGAWLLGFYCFLLTLLALLGFVYRIEFAQAVFLLLLPMSIVGLMSVSTAHKLERAMPEHPEELHKLLMWHRFKVQILGMFSILVTSLWGMLQNINVSVLG